MTHIVITVVHYHGSGNRTGVILVIFSIRSLPVSIKMLIAPAILVIMLLTFGIYTITIMSLQKADLKQIKEITDQIDFISSTRKKLTEMNEGSYKFLGWVSSGYSQTRIDSIRTHVNDQFKSVEQDIAGFLGKEGNNDDSTLHIIKATSDSLQSYIAWISKMFDMSEVDLSVASTFLKPADDLLSKCLYSLDNLTSDKETSSEQAFIRSRQRTQTLFTTFVTSIIISVFIGFIVTFQIARSVTRPLGLLQNVINRAALQDLTVSVENDSGDETGGISRALNSLIKELRTIVITLFKKSDHLVTVGNRLRSISLSLSDKSKEILTESTSVSEESTQSVEVINKISSETGLISTAIHSVSDAIKRMTGSLNDVSDFCRRELDIVNTAVTQSETASTSILHLNTAAQEIGTAIGLIKKIAEKTNLLALNASIEAAAAGDYGQGFAIVASEVKELSRQTAKTSEMITSQVNTIQSITGSSIKAIESITHIIKETSTISYQIAEEVKQQSMTIQEIGQSVVSTNANASSIAEKTRQNVEGFKSIAKRASVVNSSINRTSADIQQIQSSSNELKILADELASIVSKFKV
jgi:methyl-accepting chemotaxis protein